MPNGVIGREEPVDHLRHPPAPLAVGDQVGLLLQRRRGVCHRNSQSADGQQRLVVLRVADADCPRRRDAEPIERRSQPGLFVESGG